MPKIVNQINSMKISEARFLKPMGSGTTYSSLKPNISYQRTIANKKSIKRTAATLLILVFFIILVLVLALSYYMMSDNYMAQKYTDSSLFFTQGSISYSGFIHLVAIEDLDAFNNCVQRNKPLDQFNGVTIRYYSKPSLIGYNAIIEDDSVAKIIGGQIYGLKAGAETNINFYSQDGTFLTTRTVVVTDTAL